MKKKIEDEKIMKKKIEDEKKQYKEIKNKIYNFYFPNVKFFIENNEIKNIYDQKIVEKPIRKKILGGNEKNNININVLLIELINLYYFNYDDKLNDLEYKFEIFE